MKLESTLTSFLTSYRVMHVHEVHKLQVAKVSHEDL